MKSHYCEWGICSAWEYCCGENECCAESEFDTLLLIAVILGTLLLLVLFGSCLYYKSRQIRVHIMVLRKYMGINYKRMGSDTIPGSNSSNSEIASSNCIVEIDKKLDL